MRNPLKGRGTGSLKNRGRNYLFGDELPDQRVEIHLHFVRHAPGDRTLEKKSNALFLQRARIRFDSDLLNDAFNITEQRLQLITADEKWNHVSERLTRKVADHPQPCFRKVKYFANPVLFRVIEPRQKFAHRCRPIPAGFDGPGKVTALQKEAELFQKRLSQRADGPCFQAVRRSDFIRQLLSQRFDNSRN